MRRKIRIYSFGPATRFYGDFLADWDFDVLDADDYRSPRAKALYRALGAKLFDTEYQLAVHKDGRWGLFGLSVPGHKFAVEE